VKHIRYRVNGEIKQVEGQLDSGIVDKNEAPIFEGDTLRFTDKWEWWRCSLGFYSPETREAVLNDHEKYPYEERTVELPRDYGWLLSSEIQTYWEIIKP
jgi:hypothetical protein